MSCLRTHVSAFLTVPVRCAGSRAERTGSIRADATSVFTRNSLVPLTMRSAFDATGWHSVRPESTQTRMMRSCRHAVSANVLNVVSC
jgi:hypothetical protein